MPGPQVTGRIRLAIVDDSPFIRKAMQRLLGGDELFEVVGVAASGEELLQNIERWDPEVITLDLSMPGMGGLRTLDQIRLWKPIPVVILSTHSSKDAPLTIEALHRGASDFIDKQEFSMVDFASLRSALAAKITPIVRPELDRGLPDTLLQPPDPIGLTSHAAAPAAMNAAVASGAFTILAIGASTGGPPAIQQLLEELSTITIPVVIVQHMAPGFTSAFAQRLDAHLPIAVREATDGELLLPATVYIAPGGKHLRLRPRTDGIHAELTPEPEGARHRPSVDVLFESVAAGIGERGLGVLLTGMGRDGAEGLRALRAAGGYTLTQDEASSVVYGMPRAAVELGASRESLPLSELGRRISTLLSGDAAPSGHEADQRDTLRISNSPSDVRQ